MAQSLIVRDEQEATVATVTKVLSCDASDTLEGERTLNFTTLLSGGLEAMQEEIKYTVEFEDDLYDVVSFQKTMSGNLCFISLSCEHVSYRLNEQKLDYFTGTGTAAAVLTTLLAGTGFTLGSPAPQKTLTYSKQQSASVRAILLDFAGNNGYEVDFHRFGITLLTHRGEAQDTKIIQNNVLEISKTVNVSEESVAYSLKMKPRCTIGVGDEVHLVFRRLDIDEKVRVLGIKREPFVSENFTLEVGAYEPSLESESVQIITNTLSQNETYYGTRISADNGLEIKRGDGQASVVFNADEMAFYQGSEEILYFDAKEKKWKMSASVEIHVGDAEGNDTTLTALTTGLTTRIQNADNRYIEIKQTLDGLTVTSESGETLLDGGMIVTDNIRLNRLIAKDSPNSYVEMLTNGLNFVLGNANTIGIGYASAAVPLPYIIFGEGASPKTDDDGMIKYYSDGIWIGDSADRYSTSIASGTGLFIDVINDCIYYYYKGERSALASTAQIEACLTTAKKYTDDSLADFQPVAIFA